jgi:hypothetical protein
MGAAFDHRSAPKIDPIPPSVRHSELFIIWALARVRRCQRQLTATTVTRSPPATHPDCRSTRIHRQFGFHCANVPKIERLTALLSDNPNA